MVLENIKTYPTVYHIYPLQFKWQKFEKLIEYSDSDILLISRWDHKSGMHLFLFAFCMLKLKKKKKKKAVSRNFQELQASCFMPHRMGKYFQEAAQEWNTVFWYAKISFM